MSKHDYEIVMEGGVGSGAGPPFFGMDLTRVGAKTVLVGHIRDKYELEDLLKRVHDLGYTLVSVTSPDWQVHVTPGAT